MRAQMIESLDGPDSLHLRDVPEPAGDGQVLIDVAAAGVAFPDLLISRGQYQLKPELPFIPGVEVAGTVRSAPPGSVLAAGDRVMAVTMLGGFAEVVAAAPSMTLPVPTLFTFAQAAGFLLNYHTAHFSLVHRGHLQAGETVAVHGAAGGVGTAAVQVAHGLGATVIALTSSAAKAAVARAAGADVVIDTGGDWPAQLREATGGRGADVVLDPVGGDRFDASLRCLATGGRLLVVGFTEGRIPTVAANRLLLRNISVVGAAWGAWLAGDPALFRATNDALLPLIENGAVTPIVGATLALQQAPEALRLLDERRATGKVVLEL